jgi:hypothetical protein
MAEAAGSILAFGISSCTAPSTALALPNALQQAIKAPSSFGQEERFWEGDLDAALGGGDIDEKRDAGDRARTRDVRRAGPAF